VLWWRLFSTAVILGVLVLSCWLDFYFHCGHPGIWLVPPCMALTVLATSEVLQLLRGRDLHPIGWIVHFGTVTVVSAACLPIAWTSYPTWMPIPPAGWVLFALAVAAGMAFVGEMLRYERPGGAVINVALAFFTVGYVGLSMAFAVKLRLFGNNQMGMAALLSLVVVVKVSDIGAYCCGRMVGRHKLVPRLSPGKTVEGAIGGVVAACLGSLLVFQLVQDLPVVELARVRCADSGGGYGRRSRRITAQARHGSEGLRQLGSGAGRHPGLHGLTAVRRPRGICVLGIWIGEHIVLIAVRLGRRYAHALGCGMRDTGRVRSKGESAAFAIWRA
jgi:phosphatidate cytidylyltransferase